jgi:hypothetical protein
VCAPHAKMIVMVAPSGIAAGNVFRPHGFPVFWRPALDVDQRSICFSASSARATDEPLPAHWAHLRDSSVPWKAIGRAAPIRMRAPPFDLRAHRRELAPAHDQRGGSSPRPTDSMSRATAASQTHPDRVEPALQGLKERSGRVSAWPVTRPIRCVVLRSLDPGQGNLLSMPCLYSGGWRHGGSGRGGRALANRTVAYDSHSIPGGPVYLGPRPPTA